MTHPHNASPRRSPLFFRGNGGQPSTQTTPSFTHIPTPVTWYPPFLPSVSDVCRETTSPPYVAGDLVQASYNNLSYNYNYQQLGNLVPPEPPQSFQPYFPAPHSEDLASVTPSTVPSRTGNNRFGAAGHPKCYNCRSTKKKVNRG